ncbi:glycosyltransferase [Telmatobacter bradus]|uniref:glycosyltransferase n=1 Tax=Telmatobacter bradus TaxID=474953 RepID=UPI003B42C0E6
MDSAWNRRTAIVAIGRNEGARLKLCLRAAQSLAATVVYVDSGSADGSAEFARGLGCAVVVELDPARPFTAARARNEGFQRLLELAPATEFVQFVDGDCVLDAGWLAYGSVELHAHPEAALVRGRLVEMHPEQSVYNRLCHLEWQQTPGEIPACGGLFLIRAQVFRQVGGFREDVIAAEDDEFCLRVRAAAWKIRMVDAPMASHDAAILRFGQWWRRACRAGHAYAQVAALHSGEGYFAAEMRRLWFWGLLVPLAALLAACCTRGFSLLAFVLLYAVRWLRIRRVGLGRGWSGRDAGLYALFAVLSHPAGWQGMMQYHLRRRTGSGLRIIEYKSGKTRTK